MKNRIKGTIAKIEEASANFEERHPLAAFRLSTLMFGACCVVLATLSSTGTRAWIFGLLAALSVVVLLLSFRLVRWVLLVVVVLSLALSYPLLAIFVAILGVGVLLYLVLRQQQRLILRQR